MRHWLILLVLAFAARLTFGVFSDFWGEDELQIYLIGLDYFTTGNWPHYGPDVVYTHTRVPGALQGLLVGGPMFVLPMPEAPYVVLNVLSFSALGLLAWYITRRLPRVPGWIVWGWVLFSPWTLDVTTHIINTSYVVIGAVPFFVAVFELVPALRREIVPARVSWFALGFGALWIAQFHLSAVLLGPIALAVFVCAAREDRTSAFHGVLWCVAGAALSGATLVPTLIRDGFTGVVGQPGANVVASPENLVRLPEVLAQFLSLGSFEIARFIGASTDERIAFLARFSWAAPAVVVAAAMGIAQAVYLLIGSFRRSRQPEWPAVRWTAVLLFLLIYASFALSVKEPASHAFYFVMPAVTIYAFYVWDGVLDRRAWRIAAMVLLVSGAVTHVAIAARNFTDRSLYRDRPTVARAIEEKNYRLVGERRTVFWE